MFNYHIEPTILLYHKNQTYKNYYIFISIEGLTYVLIALIYAFTSKMWQFLVNRRNAQKVRTEMQQSIQYIQV